MNEKTASGKRPGKILWRVLFFLLLIILLAVLELGKHTILGWILLLLVFAAFFWLRSTKLKESSRGKRFLGWVCLLVLCGVILWVSFPPFQRVPATAGKMDKRTEVLHLKQGDVRGVITDDEAVEVYTGIPYAKPPVGELRWKEPEPAEGWEGVLEADHFAPMFMQTQNLPIYDTLVNLIGYHEFKISLTDNYREPASEDALYLNVWKPAGTTQEKLPVMVYVHGGSLQTGHPSFEDYRGEGLAREAGVIVVNMGYRLGIFGFLADPLLAEESPNRTTGNYGLLDQILALKWVQENIADFGGDPDNVTLAGESAGSACVSALCTSPLAKGLFRRVLLESSTVSAPEPAHSFRLLDEAFEASEETKSRFGVQSVEELRALPAKKIVGELETHHHITVDGYVLPETPYESYAKGVYNEEAQMHGFNLKEADPFLFFNPASMKDYESRVREAFDEPFASEVLALYPASTDEEAKRNWTELSTAYLFTYGHFCLARQAVANKIPSYMYYFTKDNGRIGSWHSGEEVYFYGNIPPSSNLYTEADRKLSHEIIRYVKNYMETGDPNGEGLAPWAQVTDGTSALEFGDRIGEIQTPYQELFRILDANYSWQEIK